MKQQEASKTFSKKKYRISMLSVWEIKRGRQGRVGKKKKKEKKMGKAYKTDALELD